MWFIVVLCLFLMNNEVRANEIFLLNEISLKKLINDEIPSIEKINIVLEQSFTEKNKFSEKYSLDLDGSTKYYDSESRYGKEDNFAYDFAFKKDFERGMGLKIGLKNTVNSWDLNDPALINTFYSGTEPHLNIEYSLDLWKNFLGYTDLAEKLSLNLNIEQNRIQNEIQKNNFYLSLRKIYWNLILIEKQIKIYDKLIIQAEKNLRNTELKFKSYAADVGDVSKMKSTLESREANLNSLRNKKQVLLQNLMYLIPNLNNKNIIVEIEDFENILPNIQSCKLNNTNVYEYTLYNDYIKVIDEKLEAQLKSTKRYDNVDINMVVGADVNGRNNNFGKGYEGMGKIDEHNYYVGLNFNIPLTNEKENSKIQDVKIIKMMHNSSKKDMQSNIISSDKNFSPSLNYLLANLEDLKKSRDNIEITVNNTRKKYNQGRATLTDLIDDEDSLMEIYINISVVENNVISLILDYLSIFQKIDCNFNLR